MDSPPKRSSIPIPKRKSSFQSFLSDDKSVESDTNSTISMSSSTTSSSIWHTSLTSPQIISNDYLKLKESHNQLINKYEETVQKNLTLENTNSVLGKSVSSLQEDVSKYQKDHKEIVETNRKLKKKLVEIIPEGINLEDDASSTPKTNKESNEIESLLNEMEKLKSYLNNVELQLYEANEKISELQEAKQQFEEESTKLRTENAELSNVARLMSMNMLESIDTSKRMGETLVQMKRERDSLVMKSRDSIDSKITVSDEIQRMKSEMEIKKRTYEAQFIEYKKLMEEALAKNTNEQIECLQVRVELLEKDLIAANERAEKAADELVELRSAFRSSQVTCTICNYTCETESAKMSTTPTTAAPPLPPPLPPPPSIFDLKSNIINTNTDIFSEAISTRKLSSNQQTHNKQENKATGLDSVIEDIKNGRVTLRRRQLAPQKREPSTNPALKEMYEIIAKTKRQNRTSKVLVDCELFSKESLKLDNKFFK